MSDNTHAAMCVYCGETIIYDTREVTDMTAAHAQMIDHDQQCPKNPLVGRIAFLNQQNTALQEQCDALAAHVDLLSDNLQASINGIEWYRHNTCVDWGEVDDEHLRDCVNAIEQSPSASLIRRDAPKQAEEVQRIADEFRNDVEGAYFAANLDERAKELRQQAECQQ